MKIGFLAMSGIRAHDPVLLELGLTLPGFVERSKQIASLPSLGLLYLASCTPEGHELCYYEAPSEKDVPEDVFTCDLVAISTFSAQIFEAYNVADLIRQKGGLVAMGGLHVSSVPEEAKEHVDYIILGEGENVWPEVVKSASENKGPLVLNADDFPPVDIDNLPVPRYDLLQNRLHSYNRFTVQATRGCPWKCDFCASTIMLGRPYRKRPIQAIIRDINEIQKLTKNPFLEFADDNTFSDKKWGKELCRQMIPLKLKWFTETDITLADDTELLNLMREAGCRQVLIGLESPQQEQLNGIELRKNKKALSVATYKNAVKTIQEHGITVNGCFIFGLDAHTPEIFQEVLDYATELELYDVQITVLTAFPGTPLYERLDKENRILEKHRWDLCTLFDVNFQPLNMTKEELQEGMRWLTQRLYGEENTNLRRKGFVRQMKAGINSRKAPI